MIAKERKEFLMPMRKLAILLTAVLLALSIITVPAVAQEGAGVQADGNPAKSAVFAVGVREYFLGNSPVGVKMDAAPFVANGRTYVPLRYLANALGVEDRYITWDAKSGLITLGQPGHPAIVLSIGSRRIKTGSQAGQMDVAPLVRNGRTYLPARWVAEALGYQVEWDPSRNWVVCWPRGKSKPDVTRVSEGLRGWKWTEVGYKLPDPQGELIDREESRGLVDQAYRTKAGLTMMFYYKLGYIDNRELELGIALPDDPYHPGTLAAFDQAEAILTSKFGPEFAGKVMSCARQHKSWRDSTPATFFTAPNGQKVRVHGSDSIEIMIYKS
ncbi:copper amine oxidase N-terminal domain-containing protein [Desulfofundulus sp.]|uniref:copper amine oxidase N-terminal domain-containing protein n=1 Tax=Desulfofundulus sp. TaxID=2282750 RepID=UPI003C7455D1